MSMLLLALLRLLCLAEEVEYATITRATYFVLQPSESETKRKHFLVQLDVTRSPGECD